jgi:hypothetical protein
MKQEREKGRIEGNEVKIGVKRREKMIEKIKYRGETGESTAKGIERRENRESKKEAGNRKGKSKKERNKGKRGDERREN